jgi:uncharacterized membrane protein YfcA
LLGARLLVRAKTQVLRWIFTAVLGALALEMIRSGIMGEL